MTRLGCFLFLLGVIAVSALPSDPVIRKYDEERFQYMRDGEGNPHLVDLWMKVSDAEEAARYDPDTQNIYHLFTRQNPQVSQPIMMGNNALLAQTHYSANRRTIMLVHGWRSTITSAFNTVLIPAFLGAEDVNVIAVDWSAGGGTLNYIAAVAAVVPSGQSIGRFISWLNAATGTAPTQYHLVGHSLGGHQVGIIGRSTPGNLAYITALDPAFPGWITNDDKFRPNDGVYTEVMHTNAGILGYLATLGHADFYPNGGINMPGCNSQDCDHARCYFYMAESLTSVFTGRRCLSYLTAMTGNCLLPGSLRMGGLAPKTGQSGIFYLETNAAPPFSRG